MSPSSLSYSAGGGWVPPSANSLASGFNGDGLLASLAPAALAGGGPPRSSLTGAGAESALGSLFSALDAADFSSGSLAPRLGWAKATKESSSSGAPSSA